MPHWEHRLALDVLEQDFGVTVRVVAEALAELGPASLRELFRHVRDGDGGGDGREALARAEPGDAARLIRAALLVLIAHECAACCVTVKVVGGAVDVAAYESRACAAGGEAHRQGHKKPPMDLRTPKASDDDL